MLKTAGGDFAQGYLYSKSVSAAHCGELLGKLRHEDDISGTMVMRILKAG